MPETTLPLPSSQIPQSVMSSALSLGKALSPTPSPHPARRGAHSGGRPQGCLLRRKGLCLGRKGLHKSQAKTTQPGSDRARLDPLPLSQVFNWGAASCLQPPSQDSEQQGKSGDSSSWQRAGQNQHSLTRPQGPAFPGMPTCHSSWTSELFPKRPRSSHKQTPIPTCTGPHVPHPCAALHHLLNSMPLPNPRCTKWDPQTPEVLLSWGVILGGGANASASSHRPSPKVQSSIADFQRGPAQCALLRQGWWLVAGGTVAVSVRPGGACRPSSHTLPGPQATPPLAYWLLVLK